MPGDGTGVGAVGVIRLGDRLVGRGGQAGVDLNPLALSGTKCLLHKSSPCLSPSLFSLSLYFSFVPVCLDCDYKLFGMSEEEERCSSTDTEGEEGTHRRET